MAVDEIAREVLQCVSDALEEAGRPVCASYAVVGTPVVPPGCQCDDNKDNVVHEGRAVLQFEQMYDADPVTLQKIVRVRPCKRGTRVIDLTVWVTRCYPTLNEQGELDLDAIDLAATEAHSDVDSIWAAFNCCLGESHRVIRRVAVDSDPEGGSYLIVGQITVEVGQTQQVAS